MLYYSHELINLCRKEDEIHISKFVYKNGENQATKAWLLLFHQRFAFFIHLGQRLC